MRCLIYIALVVSSLTLVSNAAPITVTEQMVKDIAKKEVMIRIKEYAVEKLEELNRMPFLEEEIEKEITEDLGQTLIANIETEDSNIQKKETGETLIKDELNDESKDQVKDDAKNNHQDIETQKDEHTELEVKNKEPEAKDKDDNHNQDKPHRQPEPEEVKGEEKKEEVESKHESVELGADDRLTLRKELQQLVLKAEEDDDNDEEVDSSSEGQESDQSTGLELAKKGDIKSKPSLKQRLFALIRKITILLKLSKTTMNDSKE